MTRREGGAKIPRAASFASARRFHGASLDDRHVETVAVSREGGVLFAALSAPPTNLLGTKMVRDLAALIKSAEADESVHVIVFKSADPDYFISHVDVTAVKL